MKSQREEQTNLEFREDFKIETIFVLFKHSHLKIEEIADSLCISYETCRNQIYAKRLSPRIWIKYYQFFINVIKK